MQIAALPPNETERLASLRRYEILDSGPEPGFDDLCLLAARICSTPIAMISLVDEHRQWFKAKLGVSDSGTCRDHAFCAHAILQCGPLIVPDTHADPRFYDNPLVTGDLQVRFYAGIPLITSDGFALGSLCVVDREPRNLTPEQITSLQALSRQAVAQLELRRSVLAMRQVNQQLGEESEQRRRTAEELNVRHQELLVAQQRTEEALQARERFLANISHELRTPLNGVVGMTELLLDSSLDGEQKDYCQTLRLSADRLLSVINDVLDFSNVDGGQLVLDRVEFSPAEIVDDALHLLAGAARSKGLRLNALIDWGIPEKCAGDPVRLRQVLMNLVSNAVRFTTQGEVFVKVSMDREERSRARLRVEVRDTGIGIPPEQGKRLFQAFSQIDESTTRPFGGAGLGLAIARRIVERMEGQIGFESKPCCGSTFWFHVWLGEVQSRRSPAADFRDKQVLFIGRTDTHSSVPAYLRGLGINLTCVDCASGHIPAKNFELVVVECESTKADAGALEIFRQQSKTRTPTILVTYEREKAWEEVPTGNDAVLTEPVRRSKLLACLYDLLQSHEDLARAPVPTRTGSPPLHVLIAEDSVVNQKVISNLLRKLGHSFDLVKDGRAAVEAAALGRYDVILMDCQMPRMDGFEATRAIRKSTGPCRDASIVALTASENDRCSRDLPRCRNDRFSCQTGLDGCFARGLGEIHSRTPTAGDGGNSGE